MAAISPSSKVKVLRQLDIHQQNTNFAVAITKIGDVFSCIQVKNVEKTLAVVPLSPDDFIPENVRQLGIKMGDLNHLSRHQIEQALDADLYIVFGASYIRGSGICSALMHRVAESEA